MRENGIPYAAFGLLWEAFGPKLLPTMWEKFDEDFIQPLDLSDNTGVPNALADAILILPTTMPWKSFVTPDIDFVVYPSTRGGYNAQAIDLDIEAGTHRCEFPSEWYGHSDAELVAISGRPGLRFCHKSGFLLAGDDLETILSVCKEAIAAKYGTQE